MRQKTLHRAAIALLTLMVLLMTALSGCGQQKQAAEPAETPAASEPAAPAETEETSEALPEEVPETASEEATEAVPAETPESEESPEAEPVEATESEESPEAEQLETPEAEESPEAEPVETPESVESPEAEPVETPEAEPEAGLQDGERYESVIMLEGMEETVRYEHIRNDALGFEMDYDYERFQRSPEAERECFISVYDDPKAPEVYLEVTRSTEDAETVAAAVTEALSEEYEPGVDTVELDRAGSCIRIDASAVKGGMYTADVMQTVYIFPASDGCRVVTAHYTFESADGFGARFRGMVNTFAVLDG